MKYQTTTEKSASDLDSSSSTSHKNGSSGYAPSSSDNTDDESSEREVSTIKHLNRNTNTFVPRSSSRNRHPSCAWLNRSSNGNNPCHTIHVTPPVSLMSDYSHRQHSQCQQFKNRSCAAIDYSNPTTQLSKNDTFYSLNKGRDADLDLNCSKGCSVSESLSRKYIPDDFLNTFSKECKSKAIYGSCHNQCSSKHGPTRKYENIPYSREMANTWNEPCARQEANGMKVAHNLNCMSDFVQSKCANSLSNNCCNNGLNVTPEQRVEMLCQRYLSPKFQLQDYGYRPQMSRLTPTHGNCSFGYNTPCPTFEGAKSSFQNTFRQNRCCDTFKPTSCCDTFKPTSCCDTFKPTSFCEPFTPNPCCDDLITKYGLESCGDNPKKEKEQKGGKGNKGGKGKGKGKSPGKKGESGKEKGDGKAKGETGKEVNKKPGKGGKGAKGKPEGGKENSPNKNEFSCFNPCSAYTNYMSRTPFNPCGAFNPCGGEGGGDKTEKAEKKGTKGEKGDKSKSPGPKGKSPGSKGKGKGADTKTKQTEDPCSGYTSAYSGCSGFTGYMTSPCASTGGTGGGDKTEKAEKKGTKGKKGDKSKSPGPKGKSPGSKGKGKGADTKTKETEDPCSGYTSAYNGCSGFTGYMTSPCASTGGTGGGDKTNKADKKGGKSNKGDTKSPGSKNKGKGASDKMETKANGFSCSPTTEPFNVEELLKKYGCSGTSQGNKGEQKEGGKKGGGKKEVGKTEGAGKKGVVGMNEGGGNMKKEGGNNKGGGKVDGSKTRESGKSLKNEPVVDKLRPSRDGRKQSNPQSKGGKTGSKVERKATRVGGCKDDTKGKVANTGRGARMSSGGNRSRSEPGRSVNLRGGENNKTNQKHRTTDNDDSYCLSKHVPYSQIKRDRKHKSGYTMSSNLNKQGLSYAAKPVGHVSKSSRHYKRSNSAPGNELSVRGNQYVSTVSSRNNSKISNGSETLKLGVPGRSRSLNDVTLSSEKSACSEFNILMSIPCDITLEETNAIVESVKTIIMEKAASSKKKSKDRSRNHKRNNPKISCMTATSPGRCHDSDDDTQADAEVSDYLTSSGGQSDIYENKSRSRSRSKRTSCDEKGGFYEKKSRSRSKRASCDKKSDFYENKSRRSRKTSHRKSRSTSSHNTDSDFDDVNFDAFDSLDKNESKHKKGRVRKEQPIVTYSQCKNPWWFTENKEDRREFIKRKKIDRLNDPSANDKKQNKTVTSSLPDHSQVTRQQCNGRSCSRNQKKKITSPIRNKSPKIRASARKLREVNHSHTRKPKKGTTSPVRDRSPNNNNFTRNTLSGIGITAHLDICQIRSNTSMYTDDEASSILDFSENISNGTKCLRSKSQNADLSTQNDSLLELTFRKSDGNHNLKEEVSRPANKILKSNSVVRSIKRTKEAEPPSETAFSEMKPKEAETRNNVCDHEKTDITNTCGINKEQTSKDDDSLHSSSKDIQRRKSPLSARSERSSHSHSTYKSTSTITLMVEHLPLHPETKDSNTTSHPSQLRSSRNERGPKPKKRKRHTLADRPMWKCSLNTSKETTTHKKVNYINDRPLIRPRKPSGERRDPHMSVKDIENRQHQDYVDIRSPPKPTDNDEPKKADESNLKCVESQTSELYQIEKSNGSGSDSDSDDSIVDMSQRVDNDITLNRYRKSSHESCVAREFESFAQPMSPIRAADVNAVYSIFQTSQSTPPTAMFVDLEFGEIDDHFSHNKEAGGDNVCRDSKLGSKKQEMPQILRKPNDVFGGKMTNIPQNAFEISQDDNDLDKFSRDSLDSDKNSCVSLNDSVCVKSYSSNQATAVSVSSMMMMCLNPTATQAFKSSSPSTCQIPTNTGDIRTPIPTSRRSKHPCKETSYERQYSNDSTDFITSHNSNEVNKESAISRNIKHMKESVNPRHCTVALQVHDKAQVCDTPHVYDKVQNFNKAQVYDKSQVYDEASVHDKAQRHGKVSSEEVTSDWYSSEHSDNSILNTSISSDYNGVIFRNVINGSRRN